MKLALRQNIGSFAVAITVLSFPAALAQGAAKVQESFIDSLPKVKSATALVVDLNSGEILFERDADLVRPIASISKLFGAMVVMEQCRLDPAGMHEMTTANREAARGGDKTKLTTGWSYTHSDLLHAALMRSDNRALPALAEACGMTPEQFAAQMTAKARALGLVKTNFREPDGLSADNVSTAREVMVALREAIKIPTLTQIMSKRDYVLTGHKDGRVREIKIKNTDRLLSKTIASLDQILGGKTGYTDIARYCLAIAARTTGGRNLGMVFLGAEGRHTRFADFTRVLKWLGESQALAANKPAASNGRINNVEEATRGVTSNQALPPGEKAPGTAMAW